MAGKASQEPGPRRRSPGPVPRPHSATIKLSDAEQALITAAAGQAGLSVGAWVAGTALAAARSAVIPDDAAYAVTWPSGQMQYFSIDSFRWVITELTDDGGGFDVLEPGKSVTITRIRMG